MSKYDGINVVAVNVKKSDCVQNISNKMREGFLFRLLAGAAILAVVFGAGAIENDMAKSAVATVKEAVTYETFDTNSEEKDATLIDKIVELIGNFA